MYEIVPQEDFLRGVGQFAQVMGIAQTVLAEQLTIGFPSIMDERARKTGEDSQGIERLTPPLLVTGDPGQHRCRQNVHPVQLTGDVPRRKYPWGALLQNSATKIRPRGALRE